MTKRNLILLLVICSSITVFTVQSLSQQRSPDLTAKQRSSRSGLDRKQELKKSHERVAKIRKEFLYEKDALGVTEEQWKLIKAKLEKIRHLREHACSTVGMGLTSSSSSVASSKDRTNNNEPTWQWDEPWKDKDPGELTDAQKLAQQLITLVENNNTTPEQFRKKMDVLRKARKEEVEIKKQLADAQKELRDLLTTRQEAALVLMKWL
jgi:hypothetical protein